jgi:hypothetical protein
MADTEVEVSTAPVKTAPLTTFMNWARKKGLNLGVASELDSNRRQNDANTEKVKNAEK